MEKAKILRITQIDTDPRVGIFFYRDRPRFLTLEPPGEGSPVCIPTGKYECIKVRDRKLFSGKIVPVTFEVQDVPRRTGILFHIGNSYEDTRGCILPAEGFGTYDFLINSEKAFTKFLRIFKDIEMFELEIESVWEGE